MQRTRACYVHCFIACNHILLPVFISAIIFVRASVLSAFMLSKVFHCRATTTLSSKDTFLRAVCIAWPALCWQLANSRNNGPLRNFNRRCCLLAIKESFGVVWLCRPWILQVTYGSKVSKHEQCITCLAEFQLRLPSWIFMQKWTVLTVLVRSN